MTFLDDLIDVHKNWIPFCINLDPSLDMGNLRIADPKWDPYFDMIEKVTVHYSTYMNAINNNAVTSNFKDSPYDTIFYFPTIEDVMEYISLLHGAFPKIKGRIDYSVAHLKGYVMVNKINKDNLEP
jgi:hypothetical protein